MTTDWKARLETPVDWAKAACDSLMNRYTVEELPPAGRWHYHQGVFLYGMIRLWKRTGDDKYFDYVRAYVDALIDDYGNFYFARDELDAIQAGVLLFPLIERTGERKYRVAAEKLAALFGTLNRTSEGGYWHKDKYPNQMWLDGLYMAGVFAVQYARAFDEPVWRERVVYQESLMRKHMRDPRTGLLAHAWDESRKAPWADPSTGGSPEYWGRSLGWYGMATADIAAELPDGFPGREDMLASLQGLLAALSRLQDKKTGLWYQVVDKGDRPDNWLETSCSALFVYAMAKAWADGFASDRETLEAARRGYAGLVNRMEADEAGRFVMPDICIGTSAGDYENYATRPKSENDLHGVGAFVMACLEMERAEERGTE